MTTRRRLGFSLFVCILSSSLTVVPQPTAAEEPVLEPAAGRPTIAGTIDDIAEAPDNTAARRLDTALAARSRIENGDTLVTVEVLGAADQVSRAVEQSGGTMGRGGGGLHLATVPLGAVGRLSDSPGVQAVQTPAPAARPGGQATRMEHMGPADSTLDGLPTSEPQRSWVDAGADGSGTKLAVFGLFDLTVLDAQIAAGEIQPIATNHRRCISAGQACPFGTAGPTYGNEMLEIISDTAPGVTIYLVEVGYKTDFYSAIDWLAAEGVTLLVQPDLWAYDGPGNGTGAAAAIIDYAVSKGIAWFNTAGEMSPTKDNYFAGAYWRGSWYDPDADRWLNWSAGDESMTVYCGALMGLRWSDWGTERSDYDLFISNFKASNATHGTRILLSANNQLGGAAPLEGNTMVRLCNTNPSYGAVYDTDGDGFVSLWVQRKSTSPSARSTGDVIELAVAYGWLEYARSNGVWGSGSGSVGIAFADSANPGMLTVGGDLLQSYVVPLTSSGWTNDGRVKPDLIAPPCPQTSFYPVRDGECRGSKNYGAHNSAAYVAGLAALVQLPVGALKPSSIVGYFFHRAVQPDFRKVADPLTGWGYPRFGSVDPPPTSHPASHYDPLEIPQRVLDTRPAPIGPIGTYNARPLNKNEAIEVRWYDAPETSVAIVLNVAVVNATGPGWLSVYGPWSYHDATSTLNVSAAGQTRANLVIIPKPTGPHSEAYFEIYSSAGGHVIADVVGYMVTSEPHYGLTPGAGRLRTSTPTRIYDSRACIGIEDCTGVPLAASTYVDVPVAGFVDPADESVVVPANALAAVLSITVDSPSQRGWLSTMKSGVTTVATSSINFEAGQSTTGLAMVSLRGSTKGSARFFVSRSAHVQVDLLGWFTGQSDVVDESGSFIPLTPIRAIDTRLAPAVKPSGGQSVAVDAQTVGVPPDAMAVFANSTALHASTPGIVQVSASPPPNPPAFVNLTYAIPGPAIASCTITRLNAGTFVMTPSTSSNLISDIAGYFQA